MSDEDVPDLLIFSKRHMELGHGPSPDHQPSGQAKKDELPAVIKAEGSSGHEAVMKFEPKSRQEFNAQPKAADEIRHVTAPIQVGSAAAPEPARQARQQAKQQEKEIQVPLLEPEQPIKRASQYQSVTGRPSAQQPPGQAKRGHTKEGSTKVPTSTMSISDSLRLAKGKFCVNHPWRHAYAVCRNCKLPYCYIYIIEDNNGMYCLNDVNLSAWNGTTNINPSLNVFSVFASLLFLANSVLLWYFMYPQAFFFGHAALSTGVIKFFTNLSPAYLIPLGTLSIAIFGILAAFAVLRRSFYALGFSLLISLTGIMLALYQYLNSSTAYFFISSAVLLLNLAMIIYSRMSAAKEFSEPRTTRANADIDWPRPETFG